MLWTTPAFGYARLGDAAATGSSLMPQKKNPDPFELVRGAAGARARRLHAARSATPAASALSYHRDLQETKAQIVRGTEHALAALDAFARAFAHCTFDEAAMDGARPPTATRVATDLADAMIARRRDGARSARGGRRTRAARPNAKAAPLDDDD